MRRVVLLPLLALSLTLAAGPPTTFLLEPDARAALHRLWAASLESRTEQVACLATTIDADTVRIMKVLPLSGGIDSLAVAAETSLAACRPPAWQGTVHTHIALRDGLRPYSKFSGSDRGVMLTWGQRWRTQGTFCLLYSDAAIHCELDGPAGSLIFPSSTY